MRCPCWSDRRKVCQYTDPYGLDADNDGFGCEALSRESLSSVARMVGRTSWRPVLKNGVMTGEPLGRGTIFDQDAPLYDAARPTYPDVLFEELQDAAGLGAGSKVLEIGAGTGQATVALAKRGYRVVALEPGPAMAEVARTNLRGFPLVAFDVTTFEAWPLPVEPFDAVVAATSFHWVNPATRVPKAAEALRIGGTLAVLSTHHVTGRDDDFFAEVQSCYERFDPATPPGVRLPSEDEIPLGGDEITRTGMFGRVLVKRVGWERAYTTREYVRLLMTYSGHRALKHRARHGLLECITRLIDSQFGGRITKRYLFELAMAPRIASSARGGPPSEVGAEERAAGGPQPACGPTASSARRHDRRPRKVCTATGSQSRGAGRGLARHRTSSGRTSSTNLAAAAASTSSSPPA
jgi:SAM-dependent methyltransferase